MDYVATEGEEVLTDIQLLDETGKVVNTIVAPASFAQWMIDNDVGPKGWRRAKDAPVEPPPPPGSVLLVESIPMLNLHLVLIEDEHLDTVEATLKAMQGKEGKQARAYWNKALTARRSNALVNQLWPTLYVDEAAFNDAWARAAALQP